MTIKEEVLEEILGEKILGENREEVKKLIESDVLISTPKITLSVNICEWIDCTIQKTLEKVEKLVNNCMSRDPEVNEKLKRIGETEPIALMTKENGRWIRKSEVLELLKKLKEVEK